MRSLGGEFSGLIGLAGGVGLAIQAWDGIKSIFFKGTELEQTNVKFEVLLGSAERAKKMLSDLTGYAVYLIDPPYLSTDTKTYHNMDYWRLDDYLDILKLLEGKSYFYFTSEKSQIVELATCKQSLIIFETSIKKQSVCIRTASFFLDILFCRLYL